MAEYIEREALASKAVYMHGFGENKYVPLKAIQNVPAADVAPVARSEWEILTDDDGNEYMRCKRCGGEFYDGDNDTVDTKHNYCPNCGADMRG